LNKKAKAIFTKKSTGKSCNQIKRGGTKAALGSIALCVAILLRSCGISSAIDHFAFGKR